MVKLRVAVRVISEDDYLQNVERAAHVPIKGEKRLLVIVREPHRWQIGALALEVQRAYKSCYQHDLPTIKYLKDNEDDCDLDPQLYVSDLLVDEGKAARDGADQRTTIKVILEQGRAIREGSVAIGSQLDNPRYQGQLQKTSRPPVPTFLGIASSLGKRSLPIENESVVARAGKRPRQIEIPEIQREETLISSIERDRSPELVQNTQSTDDGHDHLSIPQPKLESPEQSRHFQSIPSATLDELEELPGLPHSFQPVHGERRASINQGVSLGPERNDALPSPQEPFRPPPVQSQAPMTPPTDVPVRRSSSSRLQSRSKSSAQRSASASKFKRPNIYDFSASDIDDSQMSPRSKQTRLGPSRSNDRLSNIERLRSTDEDEDEDERRLSTQEALDALENDSIFESNEGPSHDIPETEAISRKDLRMLEDSEHDIYEDAPTNGDAAEAVPAAPDYGDADKENRVSSPVTTKPIQDTPEPKGTPKRKLYASSHVVHNEARSPAKEMGTDNDQNPPKRRSRANNRANRSSLSDDNSVVSDDVSDNPDKKKRNQRSAKLATAKPAQTATKAGKQPRHARRTPSLDSPGEQLVQSLQESAQKFREPATIHSKPADVQAKTPAKPPVPRSKKIGAFSESTPRQRQAHDDKKTSEAGKTARTNASTPDIVVNHAEEDAARSKLPPKLIPHWGSGPATLNKESSIEQDHTNSLSADKSSGPRKSPSVPIGFTEEDIMIMKSREGMTNEQYAADKKRKQAEAKKQAEEQKKKSAGVFRRESTGQPSTISTPSAKANNRKSVPAEATAKSSFVDTTNKSAGEVVSEREKPKAPRSATSNRETSVGGSSQSRKSIAAVAPNTPAARTASKNPPPGSQPSKTTTPPKPTPSTKANPKSGRAPASNLGAKDRSQTPFKLGPALTSVRGAAPTLATARSLTDLRAVLRKADHAVNGTGKTTSTPLSRGSSRPALTRSALHTSDDDESESESESESDGDKNKAAASTEIGPSSAGPNLSSNNAHKQTPQARVNGSAVRNPFGQPDPSIRDKSVDSDEDSDDDEDDDDEDSDL
ncbi:hypothetical protein LTS15_002942 [Exophiala xenobiotica]|nr:hypothetical protein LTS15_002942 [Exophiala xenobiotica]